MNPNLIKLAKGSVTYEYDTYTYLSIVRCMWTNFDEIWGDQAEAPFCCCIR